MSLSNTWLAFALGDPQDSNDLSSKHIVGVGEDDVHDDVPLLSNRTLGEIPQQWRLGVLVELHVLNIGRGRRHRHGGEVGQDDVDLERLAGVGVNIPYPLDPAVDSGHRFRSLSACN